MRVRKGLLETDLWGQISVLLLFSSSSSLLRVLARGGGILEPDLWGQINVLLFFFSSSPRSGSWGSWGRARGDPGSKSGKEPALPPQTSYHPKGG